MNAPLRLPRVLLCIDMPNWAFDFKSQNLIKNLCSEFEFKKCVIDDITAADIEWADIVLTYYWPNRWQLKKFNDILAKKITLCGISCPSDLEDKNREPGLFYLNICDAVFVHNQMLYDEYKTQVTKPLYFNPNGVDTKFYTPTQPKQRSSSLNVGWAGSLSNHGPKRGYHDILVPAVEMTTGVTLHTAAREEKWRGAEEMREFYRSLDVYIVASRVEGTPNPALEAAACGVPVIATRVGNMPELIKNGENGFLIERIPEALASCFVKLRDDKNLLQSMSQQMLQDIQAWDWSKRAKAYANMMTESLNRSCQK